MLSKLDIELYKILDSEVDKDLSFGCYVYLNWNRDYPEVGKICRIWDDTRFKHSWNKSYIKFDSIKEWFEIDKILGHYPTTNEVLRYIMSNWNMRYWYQDEYYKWILVFIDIWGRWEKFKLNIKTPIQKQTDEEKQNLIDFLKLIK